MTREEALQELVERVRCTEYVDSTYVDCVEIEALRIAIEVLNEALTKPKTHESRTDCPLYDQEDDTISRQAAIEELRTCYDTETITDTNGNEYIDYEQAVELIEKLPSVDPEQKWIPVSEKNPPESEVICCDKYGEIMIAFPFEDDVSDTGFSAENDECYMYNVVAWMEAPEPYKGEEE